jgi:hypothetical protein
VVFAFDGAGYWQVEHNFADPGVGLTDVDRDGTTEFLASDARFAYRFTSFACSVLPVRVWLER